MSTAEAQIDRLTVTAAERGSSARRFALKVEFEGGIGPNTHFGWDPPCRRAALGCGEGRIEVLGSPNVTPWVGKIGNVVTGWPTSST